MKKLIAAFCFLTVCLSAKAQKLPDVQPAGLRAPTDIKIDGKSTEWGVKFQAYNHTTDVFYSLANDDDNLYLTASSADPLIIGRLFGGITLSFPKSGKKDIKNAITVTYPAEDGKGPMFLNLVGRKGADRDTSAHGRDSMMQKYNAYVRQKAKWVKVTGVAGVDTMLSVYNTNGIEAAGLFNNRIAYTIEMAIPLKYLGLSVNGSSKFIYNFKINGSPLFKNTRMSFSPNPSATPEQLAQQQKMIDSMNNFGAAQSAPTDFWGEYTLVSSKK